jgi:hypothetical protein
MDIKYQEQVSDYLEGFKQLRDWSSFPIGAIIISDDDRAECLELAKTNSLKILEADSLDEVELINSVVTFIKNKQKFVVNSAGPVSSELLRQLDNLMVESQIVWRIPGEKEDLILKAEGEQGLIFLVNENIFSDSGLQKFTSSVCRLR